MNSIRSLMKVIFLSFVVGCCTGTMSSSKEAPETVQKSADEITFQKQIEVERLRQSTVAIIEHMGDNSIPVCAGVWVSENSFITAAHCVEKVIPIYEYAAPEDYAKKEYKTAVAVAADKEKDLALMIADPQNISPHPVVIVSNGPLSAGDEVDIIGHTMGLPWTYSKGYISAFRGDLSGPAEEPQKLIQISAPVWMGNSGGGAFDRAGNLVGICSWVVSSGPQLSFFTDREVVREFVVTQLAKL